MKAGSVASFTISETLRATVLRTQAALLKAQTEMSSGRVADAGLALGARTGRLVSFARQTEAIEAMLDSNSLAASRMEAGQAALQDIAETAGAFQQALITATAGGPREAVLSQAQDALRALARALGTTAQGEHIFAGVNTDAAPLADYFGPAGRPARDAVASAFSAAFGMAQTDPAVGSLDAASVRSFLDGSVADLFDDAGWKNDWSSAADEPRRSTIAPDQTIAISVGANEPALRKLAMAYTMVADLGAGGMNPSAYQAVLDKAAVIMGEAIQGVTALRAQLGSVQSAVQAAQDQLTAQKAILAKAAGALVDVDPYATAARVNDLRTQLETAYALTGRLQDLSLLKFI